MTKARRKLLDIIAEAEIPLSAGDIHALMDQQYDLATVYRGLNYFEKQGTVESFTFSCSQEGTERYYYRRSHPHTHFFHCASCHRFIPLGICSLHDLERQLEADHGVVIQEHTLYFTGLCSSCRAPDQHPDADCSKGRSHDDRRDQIH